MHRASIALVALVLLSVGCADQVQSPFASRPEVAAPSDLSQSFAVVANETSATQPAIKVDKAHIQIKRSALEKEFLLQSEIIEQTQVPKFNGLKSRVVAFRLRQNKVYLLEATQGHTVTDELPQELLLVEFNVIKNTNDYLTIDFNQGMSNVFVASEWRGQDSSGGAYGDEFKSVRTRISYIEEAKLESDRLTIKQVAQLAVPRNDGESITPVSVVYYLKPYNPDPSFEPTRSLTFDRMGFFEVAPQLSHGGGTVVYATKFHTAEPITYAVSANTPKDYRQAVKDGVLYWNKAMGKEILRVVEAPEGVSAPNPDFNLIQWVNWNDAGYAYADAQADPRTGQIHHAQVFMTSAFAFNSRAAARKMLKRIHSAASHSENIALAGFQKDPMCDLSAEQQLASSVVSLLSTEADDEKFLEVSRDYVRHVIAHEIGHTLGLRHNFAGSLAANYPAEERQSYFDEYLQTGTAASHLVPTSSVMEYLPFEDDALAGDIIEKKDRGFKYDEVVMKSLYGGETFADEDIPLFCTDSHTFMSPYVDCERFDYGPSTIEYSTTIVSTSLHQLPFRVMETYVSNKAPAFGAPSVPVDKVSLAVDSYATNLMAGRQTASRFLYNNSALLKIHRQFSYVGPVNEDIVRQAELDYLAGEFERKGGIATVLGPFSENFADSQFTRLTEILDSGKYDKGQGSDKKDYSFSAEEKTVIKTNARIFFDKLQKALWEKEVALLGGDGVTQKLIDHPLAEQYAAHVATRMKHFLQATTAETIVAEVPVQVKKGDKMVTELISVSLPKFRYDHALRVKSAGLLKSTRSENPIWGYYERAEVKKEFSAMLKDLFKGHQLSQLKMDELPRSVARWVFENKQVLAAIQ